eukprot:1158730-Pelagomonas_calceolata.AAC.8
MEERKGKGYIAVPAYVGSLAEAKKMPVTKSVQAEEQEQNMEVTAFQARAGTECAVLFNPDKGNSG